eukprot:Awhi_evm2s1457
MINEQKEMINDLKNQLENKLSGPQPNGENDKESKSGELILAEQIETFFNGRKGEGMLVKLANNKGRGRSSSRVRASSKDRTGSGGGVKIVHNPISFKEEHIEGIERQEYISITIQPLQLATSNKKVNIELIDKPAKYHKNSIILGDLNTHTHFGAWLQDYL